VKNASRLVLIEGICGSGKSTLAERLYKYLLRTGSSAFFYDEGARNHPVSLNGHAFLKPDEYDNLLKHYPCEKEILKSMSIIEDTLVLIPYRDIEALKENTTLYDYLKAHELCWTDKPVASLSDFSLTIQKQWKRFEHSVIDRESIFVLEGVFFQHPIHDLLRNYQASDMQIISHIQGVANQISGLQPVLIYLSQSNIREQQIKIAQMRCKPHYATETNIRFMENRTRIETLLLCQMPFPTYTIENEDLDWNKVFAKITNVIDTYQTNRGS
jgi:uridine kinase